MRIFVLGATGKTGTQILDLALERGHDVTAFVRSPHKLERRERLAVVQGDVKSVPALTTALHGHDVVLSAIGAKPREALRPSTLMTDCAAATVAAMATAGVSRLGIVSAAVLFDEPGLSFAFFRWLLKHHARDLQTMEAVVRGGNFAWTVARPPRLIVSPDTRYSAMANGLPAGRRVMSFRAVAAFLLDAVETDRYAGQVVGLTQ